MFININEQLININHIVSAEWQELPSGQTLMIYTVDNRAIHLSDTPATRRAWEFINQGASTFTDSD